MFACVHAHVTCNLGRADDARFTVAPVARTSTGHMHEQRHLVTPVPMHACTRITVAVQPVRAYPLRCGAYVCCMCVRPACVFGMHVCSAAGVKAVVPPPCHGRSMMRKVGRVYACTVSR